MSGRRAAHSAARRSARTLGGALALAALAALGCATKRPVLYPNAHLQEVGAEGAQSDVARCLRLAEEYGLGEHPAAETAEEAAKGSARGAAAGAAAGAVLGSAGRGAAAGAAAGGARGAVTGIFGARDPDPLFKRFVDQCLAERGYRVIGWR